MESDNPPVLTASEPDAGDADRVDDADPKTDILAFESKIDSSKAEKENETAGLAVGNKKDADANREEVEVNPFIDLLASQSKRDKEKKKATGLALAPAIEPHDPGRREVCTPSRLARHRKNRRERQAFAEEEKTEIVVDAGTTNYRATRLDEEDPQEELEDNYDSDAAPGAVRIGGNEDDDYTSAPSQAESLEVGLSPPAASSAALLLQAELAPDTAEEIARAVIEERERVLKERDHNIVLATAVEVDDVEGNRWKLKILLFVLFVIGTVTTLSIVFTRERSNPADPPTMIPTDPPPTMIPTDPPPTMIPTDPPATMIPTDPPTMSRLSIMRDVIASSFEDDFPNSSFQVSALDWLVNLDPASLPVDTNSTILLERYIAVLFYFATQGDGWTDQTGWLSENPLCSWYGLECTDEGFLRGMDLGTCLLSSFCLCSKSVRSFTKYALLCPVFCLDFRYSF